MNKFSSLLLRGTAWKFIFYATSYALTLYIAHNLGAGESGHFYYLLNNLSLIVFLLSFGFDSTVSFYNSKRLLNLDKLLSLGIVWGFLTTSFFAFTYYILLHERVIQTSVPLIYILLFVIGSHLTSTISSLFFSSNDGATPNVIPAIINVLFILLIMLIQKALRFLLPVYLLLPAITSIILYMTFLLKRKFIFSLKHIPWKNIIHYSFYAFISNVFINLLLRADYWLVKEMSSDSDLGNYILTSKFAQMILMIPSLASFMLFPLITQGISDKKSTEERILKLIAVFFYQSLVLCIVIAILGYWLFPFLYGSSFYKMFITFLFLIPGLLSLSITFPITPYFSGIHANEVLIKNAFLGLGAMLVADILLIKNFSIFGAAIGSSIGYFVYCFGLLTDLRKHFEFKLNHILRVTNIYSAYKLLINNFKSKLHQ